MLLHLSKRNAPPTERPQVTPVWLVLLLAGLIGSSLWTLYPRNDLEEILYKMDGNIDLTESYVRNLLRSEPENPNLLDLLNRIEKIKALREAPTTVKEDVVEQPAPAQKTPSIWDLWQENYHNYQNAVRDHSIDKENYRRAALSYLQKLPDEYLDEAQLLFIAQAAVVLEDLTLAQKYFTVLMKQPGYAEARHEILEIAARSALAQGFYEQAAKWYVDAAHAATSIEKRREYLLSALDTLQAANKNNESIILADREFNDFLDDPLILRKLIDISRAVGRGDAAQRYSKRLLRISSLHPYAHMASLNSFRWDHDYFVDQPQMRKVADRQASSTFDDKTYELGFTVFIENQNYEDAWRIARDAVRQAPTNIKWRKRLAEVSEWTERPSEAAMHWLVLAKQTNDHQAWQSVRRISSALRDDRLLAEALRYQMRIEPRDKKWLLEAVAAYERLGEPEKAIDLLRNTPNQDPLTVEKLATLYEDIGQEQQALQQWEILFRDSNNITPDRAIKAAILALKLGKGEQGLKWMQIIAQRPATDTKQHADFLRTYGKVADIQNVNAEAEHAYRALLNMDDASAEDFDNFIVLLKQQQKFKEASSVAYAAWKRLQQPIYLTESLSLFSAAEDWQGMGPVVHELENQISEGNFKQTQIDPSIYLLLGNYYQHIAQQKIARTLYETGMRQFPDSTDLQEAALWLAIDTQDIPTIQKLLQHYEEQWQKNQGFHDALAAAYQALSLPQVALDRYLSPRLAEKQGDFLWMMTYADVLEQNQQVDLAWQIRKKLIQELVSSNTPSDLHQWMRSDDKNHPERIARARLLISQYPGDSRLRILREIISLNDGPNSEITLSPEVRDVLISWYLDHEQPSAVRARLWERFARSRSQNLPLWAEIAAATDERATLGQLFDQRQEAFERHDRVSTAMLVGDTRLAQTSGFESQTYQTNDDALHQQLMESLLDFSHHAGVRYQSSALNELGENTTTAFFHWALSPRWSADLSAYRTQRHSRDQAELVNPSDETGIDTYLRWRNAEKTGSFRFGQRKSLDTYHPVQAQWEQQLGQRFRWRLEAGHSLPTEESTLLRIAGKKQRIGTGITYQFSLRDTFSIDQYYDKFSLQNDTHIGSGRVTSLYYAHQLRIDTPSIELGAFWSSYHYRDKNISNLNSRDLEFLKYLPPNSYDSVSADMLIPKNFNYFGVNFSTNQKFTQEYTRSIQPFASITLTHHSRDGAGYDVSLGLAGKVLGQDHLLLGINFSKSSPQSKGTIRELQLSYRRHF